MKVTVKIKPLNEGAVVPFKTYNLDMCYDVVAVSEEEVAPNVWKYGLGFACEMSLPEYDTDKCYSIDLRPRPSIWKTGMVLSNSIGTIDYLYRGEISAVFYHVMPSMPRYKVGDKIGQICISETPRIVFRRVDELNETDRGVSGYGSTGLNVE